jgi:hypothetical protein
LAEGLEEWADESIGWSGNSYIRIIVDGKRVARVKAKSAENCGIARNKRYRWVPVVNGMFGR